MKKSIFIVGTGRSGTHWLGNILENSNEVNVKFERWPIFNMVTQSALNAKKKRYQLPLIILYYKSLIYFSNHHVVDKCHPNLWHVDSLAENISNSYFIGIVRSPYATISSMIIHKGVLEWIYKWEKYPVPNKFLGITNENINDYSSLSLVEKCMLRWISHKNELVRINNEYNNNVLLLKYEELITNTENEVAKIEAYLKLKEKLALPLVKESSLNKWKDNLTQDNLDDIRSMLIKYNLEEYIENE